MEAVVDAALAVVDVLPAVVDELEELGVPDEHAAANAAIAATRTMAPPRDRTDDEDRPLIEPCPSGPSLFLNM
jgi:hypothetical protein